MSKELAELRQQLQEDRKILGDLVKSAQGFIDAHILTKTAYERAFARAKVREAVKAKTTADKQPTILNALAELDEDVIATKDKYDMALAKLEAFKVELNAAEEGVKSTKKAMSTIETEMRCFG